MRDLSWPTRVGALAVLLVSSCGANEQNGFGEAVPISSPSGESPVLPEKLSDRAEPDAGAETRRVDVSQSMAAPEDDGVTARDATPDEAPAEEGPEASAPPTNFPRPAEDAGAPALEPPRDPVDASSTDKPLPEPVEPDLLAPDAAEPDRPPAPPPPPPDADPRDVFPPDSSPPDVTPDIDGAPPSMPLDAAADFLPAPDGISILLDAASDGLSIPDPNMSFFVTSTRHSGDLGGIAGADAECQRLAAAVDMGHKTWRAYLSAENPVDHARDRIGMGPWVNHAGTRIADDLAHLHEEAGRLNNVNLRTSLTENGVPLVGKALGDHDVITGSRQDGTVEAGKTCRDWTMGEGSDAQVGHADHLGDVSSSWNSAHAVGGCSYDSNFRSNNGYGRFYCFATGP